MTKDSLIQQAFEVAAERYAAVGVDVRKALEDMKKISLSLHCWQADDVSGFENQGGSLTGSIQVTGNYPGTCPYYRRVASGCIEGEILYPR